MSRSYRVPKIGSSGAAHRRWFKRISNHEIRRWAKKNWDDGPDLVDGSMFKKNGRAWDIEDYGWILTPPIKDRDVYRRWPEWRDKEWRAYKKAKRK